MNLADDVRYAFRLMRRNPGFAAVAISALALGIGANSAIFSVVNAVLVRPMPYAAADRVGIVWEKSAAQGWSRINPSGPDVIDFKEQATTLAAVAVIETGSATINGFGEPQQIPGMRVSTNLFSMLGIKPALGRDFAQGEGWKDRVAVISNTAWRKWFGADPRVVGRSVQADGIAYTIIGVLPPGAWMPIPSDFYAPWSDADLRGRNRMEKNLAMLARLNPGVTWKQASAELDAIERRIAEKTPRMKDWSAYVLPFQDWISARTRPALLLLLAAVGLVLLIACTNLANLMLARAAGRERDVAVRVALGAAPGTLVRQFLTESVVLGLLGGLAGLLLAVWGVDILNRIVPQTLRMPASNADYLRPQIVIDGAVLCFTAAAAVLSGVLFGLAPALVAARSGLGSILRGSRGSAPVRTRTLRDGLVVAEVAVALVLLVAATLVIQSFWNLRRVQPGFASDHLLVMETELPTDSRYRTDAEMARFHSQVLANLAAIPGVRSAGVTCSLPMDAEDHKTDFTIDGKPLPDSGQRPSAHYRSVSEDYFATMGIPVLSGRAFTPADTSERPPVVVVDAATVRRYWEDGTNPIGRKIRLGRVAFEVVGVVGDIRNDGLDKQPEPIIYTAFRQQPEPQVRYVIRHPTPEAIVNSAKTAVYSVDKDQPVYNIRTMDEVVSGSQAGTKLAISVVGAFAFTALVLASLGIYGVISYVVTERTREIGIRMALGARFSDVVRMVLAGGLRLAGIGIAAGAAAGLVVNRLLSATLYGVSAVSPAAVIAMAALLASVALVATLAPAIRAARTSPVVSLRYE
ncbi:MAG: ABC transporter permease [Acidobacteria bacterium]|nr:ABC transporter permease [Acidobacteriota bacterium]